MFDIVECILSFLVLEAKVGVQHFLTVAEVADLVRVRPQTVRAWLKVGVLKGFQLRRGEWRIRSEDLDEFIQGQVRKDAARV